MSRNGSGVYNLPATNPVVPGSTISTTWANGTMTDIATTLTGSLAADGQTPMSGNLNLNSNKIVNLAPGTVNGNAIEYAQFLAAFVNPTFTGDVTMSGTGFVLIPKGTTAQRPLVPVAGEIRYNTEYNAFEGYANGAWGNIGGGATGGGSDQVFVENGMVVTTNYTLTTGKSAESVGPITVIAGVTVSIPSASRWVIL